MLVYGAGVLSAVAAGLVVLEIGMFAGRLSRQAAVVPPPAGHVASPAPEPRNLLWRAQLAPRPEDYRARLAFGALESSLKLTSNGTKNRSSEQPDKVLALR